MLAVATDQAFYFRRTRTQPWNQPDWFLNCRDIKGWEGGNPACFAVWTSNRWHNEPSRHPLSITHLQGDLADAGEPPKEDCIYLSRASLKHLKNPKTTYLCNCRTMVTATFRRSFRPFCLNDLLISNVLGIWYPLIYLLSICISYFWCGNKIFFMGTCPSVSLPYWIMKHKPFPR